MKEYRSEALRWLEHASSDAAFDSDQFDTTQDAIAVVKRLYEAGAVLVEAKVKEEGGIGHTNTLIVHGTEESADKLFNLIWSLHPDEIHYTSGDFAWLLWWD